MRLLFNGIVDLCTLLLFFLTGRVAVQVVGRRLEIEAAQVDPGADLHAL